MKRFREAIVPLVVAGTLVQGGCADPGPELDETQPSRVMSTWYDDRDVTNVSVCVATNEDGLCTSSVNVPIVDEEFWNMLLRQCENGAGLPAPDETCATEEFEISEQEFGRIAVDDVVVLEGDQFVRLPQ